MRAGTPVQGRLTHTNAASLIVAAVRFNVYPGASQLPFHVAAPITTFDAATPEGHAIPIEERDADEVTHHEGLDDTGATRRIRLAPLGTPVRNPAFDVTPARFITGFVTERGCFPATAEAIAAALEGTGH